MQRYSCQIVMRLELLDIFAKSTQVSNFMTIRQAGAELFHADRRTDMAKLIIAIRSFANVPNKY